MSRRPAVVAFDVIDTLMSLEPLRERLTGLGQPPHMLEAWSTRTLRDGMALSATGDFVPFADVAAAALRALTHYTISDEQVAGVMQQLLGWSYEDRVANACIGVERADLVLAGCAILDAMRRAFPCQRLRVADRGLREGMLVQMMREDGVWDRGGRASAT